jgi:hypothetical protein
VSLGDELRAGGYSTGRHSHPPGYEPGHELTGDAGTAVVAMPQVGSSHEDLLREAGFDPAEYSIVGPVKYRKWMRYDQEWLHYFKFDIDKGAESDAQREVSIEEIRAMIGGPRAEPGDVGGDDAWMYAISDWQIGKGEGDGTKGTVDRVLQSVELAKKSVDALRKTGHLMPELFLPMTGDLGEGTCGFYPGQGFLIDCNRRTQNRITRELLCHVIDELAPRFETVHVATVGGNHGENRGADGKKITDNADNDDVAQVEAVAEAYRRAGADHVRFTIPDDELSILVDVAGVKIGLTHGHLMRSGGKLPQAKALEWWKGQDFGFGDLRDAKILLSSHFHHYSCIAHGWRTHFQTPAMDPGSRWVADAWGSDSPAGVLTMRIDKNNPLGWADVQVLGAMRPERA